MRAKAGIIALVLSISFYAVTCNDRDVDTSDERPKVWTFGKYYKPYEPNIEPDAPGYMLPLEINDIVNVNKINKIIDNNSISNLIKQNGFAIMEQGPYSPLGRLISFDFVSIYKSLGEVGILPFVTTDTGLYLYHTQFNETLKDIEENLFVSDIKNLTSVLIKDALLQYEQLEGDLKEAAKRNVAYLSVAQKLINPNAAIPELIDDLVVNELAKIKFHSGFRPSDIFIYDEDYSQYVPRGHYTQSEVLKQYFKTMMWYGRMAFLLRGSENWGATEEALVSVCDARIQTLQSVLLATSLRNVQISGRTGLDIWDRIYKVTSFYVGLADDLTPYDYLWALDQILGNNFVLSDLVNKNNLFTLKKKLALLPSPKIYGGAGNIVLDGPITADSLNEVLDKTRGMRLMGRRFAPDSYMFQHLVFPNVGNYTGAPQKRPFTVGQDDMGGLCRAYVRGLDLMALLGSDEAFKILTDEGDTDYRNFWKRFGELKDEFDALSSTDLNINLYWSWLYTLRALLDELPEGYPEFMRTQAWNRRQLNAALASWTQLRHDTILYAKQGSPPPPASRLPTPQPGYVEPNPVFWGRLLSLTRMTSKGLKDLNVMTPEAQQRLSRLEELLQQILDIVAKQLTNESLSPENRKFFKKLPSNLALVVRDAQGQCPTTTLVADVHTNPAEAMVVEEAVGEIDLIVVACPMDGDKAFLAVGPVLSYYEFKHPMNDRLTDHKWRKLLESPKKPEQPKWYVPLMWQSDNSSTIRP